MSKTWVTVLPFTFDVTSGGNRWGTFLGVSVISNAPMDNSSRTVRSQ